MTSTIKVNKIEKESGSTLTLGGPGTAVTLACGATQTGFGRTGTVDWCTTAKTSPFTAVSGDGFFVNTSGGTITVTLPSSPSAGDIVAIADYANTWDTNNVTVDRGGSKINGACTNASLGTKGQSVTLVYVDGTRGWKTVTDSTADVTGSPSYVAATGGNATITSGDYKTHIFTGDGTFTVSSSGQPGGSNKIDYFVVAGGAGGAGRTGGGGGAGGFRLSNEYATPAPTMSPLSNPTGLSVAETSYTVTVGAGGAGSPDGGSPDVGTSGSTSIFSSISSAGGGGGVGTGTYCGVAGGSGGGGAGEKSGSPSSGGAGNTPPVSPPQGNTGGTGTQGPLDRAGGGGGGSGAVGTNGSGQTAGPGGAGTFIADTIIGPTAPSYGTSGPVSSTRYFGGGGGAGVEGPTPAGAGTNGSGGSGGGGQGGPGPTARGTGGNGTANTGGGAGAASRYGEGPGTYGAGGTGGSGIVMIRYKFQN